MIGSTYNDFSITEILDGTLKYCERLKLLLIQNSHVESTEYVNLLNGTWIHVYSDIYIGEVSSTHYYSVKISIDGSTFKINTTSTGNSKEVFLMVNKAILHAHSNEEVVL